MSDATDSVYPFRGPSALQRFAVLVAAILPLLATAFAIVLLWGVGVDWLSIGLFFAFWGISGLGISVGYHRMLTHGAFQARPVARAVLLIMGTMALQGPPGMWAATHRRHHAKADREGDPHSPLEGLFHAHFGWMVKGRFVEDGPAYDQIMRDPVVRWVQKTQLIWIVAGFVLPGLIAFAATGTWMGLMLGVLWGGAARVFIMHHMTWAVNSIGHAMGTRPYKSPDVSRNNGILALFSFGEGWHNNHHAFPDSAWIGHRWYQIDLGRYMIAVLRAFRLVSHLRVPTKAEMKARLRRFATPAKQEQAAA